MKIKIQESLENTALNPIKKVNAKFISTGDEIPLWSFKLLSGNQQIFHSGNAEEGVFLNYGNPLSPTIEITLPTQGNYEIQLVAKVTTYAIEEVKLVELDENNLPFDVLDKRSVGTDVIVKSVPIILALSDGAETWL